MSRTEECHFESASGLDQHRGWLELFDKPNRGSNAFGIILKGLENTLRANIDIEHGQTGIDTDIDFILVWSVHELRFLCLAIRARGPYDYSSCT